MALTYTRALQPSASSRRRIDTLVLCRLPAASRVCAWLAATLFTNWPALPILLHAARWLRRSDEARVGERRCATLHQVAAPARRPRPTRNLALAAVLVAALVCASAREMRAATATTTMPVTMTITAGCTVAATSVAFGTQSSLAAATTASGTLSVNCTNTTPYNVGLDQGSGSGATVGVRKMTGPASAIINYGLYQNSALTTVFGNTVGTNTVAGTGNGAVQTITVYGQVPAQASPAPGSYADTVNVTVTF